ncbi:MAG: Stage sporulation protein [Clostridiales bacterium]|nr:Stage sporulation protein [Clostridiales bacterium]
MQTVMDTVRELAIFMVLASMIKSLIGKSTYSKYIEFFIGLLMIGIMLRPLEGYLMGGERYEDKLSKLFEDWSHLEEEEMPIQNGTVDEAILYQAQLNIEEEISVFAKEKGLSPRSCKVILEEGEEAFGEVKSVALRMKNGYQEEQNEKKEQLKNWIMTQYGVEEKKISIK